MRLLAAVALVVALACVRAAEPIERFVRVDDGFYRGAQPDPAGFEFLASRGIRTVINLRMDNDEEPLVRGLGLRYVHIPVRVGFGDRIPDAAVRRVFEILADPASRPVFLHCRRGADRTGAMAGFYRIAVQGWDPERAYAEARAIGMRWWYRGLERQIETFDAGDLRLTLPPPDPQQSPAAAVGPRPH